MAAWTRRSILKAVGAAAAGAVPPVSGMLSAASNEASPLPPPLKAEVFRERQESLRRSARARGLDALFVTPSTNLAWAANLSIGRSERLTALLLLTEGPAILVTPSFEESNHKRTAVVDEVRTWNEDQDPLALTAKVLAGKRAVGVEGSTSYATAVGLASAASAKLEEATPVFDPLRMIKSEEEQGFIRDAARRTTLAISATHKRLRAGMTESEVARLLEEEFARLNVRGGGLVQFGPSSAFPHGGPEQRRLARGDAVLIDAGCKVRG
ncbi:MAG: aminopeptidase P family N-terminal domain-containing protein, partial [Acidobacteriota bacterium]|nr:aminopeptidase P family N-terminal domain-containing protein [Acidobacteriota bacterium]